MIEGDLLKRQWRGMRQQFAPCNTVCQGNGFRIAKEVGEEDCFLDCWQRLLQVCHSTASIKCLTSILIAIDGEKKLRLYLLETVNHSACAKVRGTT